MPEQSEIVDTMAGLTLFADLTRAQVEGVSHIFEEQWFAEGERILRQGLGGSALYVILDGEAAVHVDGQRRAALSRGDFFGEISVLLGDPPSADVVAVRPVRCAVLAGPEVETFLLTYPRVMYRMLQMAARRLRQANLWRS